MTTKLKTRRGERTEEGYVEAVWYSTVLIGRQLKAMREAAGLTQAEVAARAGVRPEALSRLEAGNGNPTVSTVERVVKAIEGRS
jgi:predicted transcriptional regulator